MFLLKKTAEVFILPPGIFIVALLLAGIVLLVRKRWLAGALIGLLTLSAWVVSTTPFADVFLGRLEAGLSMPASPAGDVIIVLGAGVNQTMPDITGVGALTKTTAYRLFTAYRLQRKVNVPILFSGAGNSSDVQPVKSIVIRIMKDMGVPENKILIEDQSRDTRESAAYAAGVCAQKGFYRPILISSAYHLKRSVYCFKKEGLDVIPFPARFETWEGKSYTWLSYLPGNFSRFSMALKEIIGLKVYQVKDWFQDAP